MMFLQGAPRQVHPWAGTPPHSRYIPGQVQLPRQVHPPGKYTPKAGTPPWAGTAPGAVHAGRYGQQVGGMHITGMHSC